MKFYSKILGVAILSSSFLFSGNGYAAESPLVENYFKSSDPKVVLSNEEYNALNNELNSGGYKVDMSNIEITYQDDDIIVGNVKTVNEEWLNGFKNSNTVVTKNIGENKLLDKTGMQKTTVKTTSGYAKLDNFGGRGRALRWAVRPNTYWPYIFSGTISLNYYSGYKRTATVRDAAALHGEASGFVYMNENNGGTGTLNGTAYASDGHGFMVMPGVSVAF